MSLIIVKAQIVKSMYRAGEVPVHKACCERATQPTHLEKEVRFIQVQDQQGGLDGVFDF